MKALVVQHEKGCTPAWLGEWLVAAGVTLDVRHPYAGDSLPADLDGHDLFVVLGGAMGANDDDACAWLPATKELVRLAAARDVPTLGLCLGHQICAVALGGTVERNPAGRRLGVVPVEWSSETKDDPLFGGLVGARIGVHWNDDVVTALPPRSRLLATTPAGEPEVVRFARTVWGVQLHPEADDRVLASWGVEDAVAHGRPDPAVAAAVAEVVEVRSELERSWRPLAARFAALAR